MDVRFTARAEADIIDSYLYGLRAFGIAEAERYERGLRHAISLIADNPYLASQRREYSPPVRIHHHAKHYIVYVVEDGYVLILRILRDESDLRRHL